MVLSKKGLKIINCMLRHHPYYYVFEDPPHTSNIQTNEPLKNNNPPFNLVQTCPLNFNTVSSLYASMIISSHPPPPIVSLVLRYLICTAVRFSPKRNHTFFTFFSPRNNFSSSSPSLKYFKNNLPPRLLFPFLNFRDSSRQKRIHSLKTTK